MPRNQGEGVQLEGGVVCPPGIQWVQARGAAKYPPMVPEGQPHPGKEWPGPGVNSAGTQGTCGEADSRLGYTKTRNRTAQDVESLHEVWSPMSYSNYYSTC